MHKGLSVGFFKVLNSPVLLGIVSFGKREAYTETHRARAHPARWLPGPWPAGQLGLSHEETTAWAAQAAGTGQGHRGVLGWSDTGTSTARTA